MATPILATGSPLLSAFFQFAMSCPICGKVCRCAEPRTYESVDLVDIDPYDDTEEQFASSVAGLEHPTETMHSETAQSEDEILSAEQVLASGSLSAAQERYAKLNPDMMSPDVPSPDTHEDPEAWRDELNSRLQSYKARRRRSLGDESLSFNFESTIGNHVFLRPEREPEPEPVQQESPSTPYMHSAVAPALEETTETTESAEPMGPQTSEVQQSFAEFRETATKPIFVPETAKLILFPRPPMMAEPRRDELAEAVFETPRILDAPESVEAVAVPLSDITLQPKVPEDQCVPHADPELELPFKVAPMAQRIGAEVLDTMLALVASGVFGVIVAKLNPSFLLQDARVLGESMLLVAAALWSLYKYIFLVYNGKTLGMRMARLQLVDFNGLRPKRRARCFRALAMLVSIFPLGLGLLWAFVDIDTLCWHDRISRTYMTAQ